MINRHLRIGRVRPQSDLSRRCGGGDTGQIPLTLNFLDSCPGSALDKNIYFSLKITAENWKKIYECMVSWPAVPPHLPPEIRKSVKNVTVPHHQTVALSISVLLGAERNVCCQKTLSCSSAGSSVHGQAHKPSGGDSSPSLNTYLLAPCFLPMGLYPLFKDIGCSWIPSIMQFNLF